MKLSCDVIAALQGKTLATAESCTGGGIGAELTAVPGSSRVYKGGIVSYTNEIKINQLGVDPAILNREGAVSGPIAEAMATGVRKALKTDVAISVTGLAGPDGDDFGNPVGTVYIGYSDKIKTVSKKCFFTGSRQEIRQKATEEALKLILKEQ